MLAPRPSGYLRPYRHARLSHQIPNGISRQQAVLFGLLLVLGLASGLAGDVVAWLVNWFLIIVFASVLLFAAVITDPGAWF